MACFFKLFIYILIGTLIILSITAYPPIFYFVVFILAVYLLCKRAGNKNLRPRARNKKPRPRARNKKPRTAVERPARPEFRTVIAEEIGFYPEIYTQLIIRNTKFLSQWQGTCSTSAAPKAFSMPGVVRDIKQFHSRHFADMVRASLIEKLNWQDERICLFLDLMRSRYGLTDRMTMALLVYVHGEVNYKEYAASFGKLDPSDFGRVMREIALRDIYFGRHPNFRYIYRLLSDLGVPKKKLRYVEPGYAAARKSIELSQFGKSLYKGKLAPYVDIESEIRNNLQFATINAKISSFLDTSPENYYIVAGDYRRDSRIDSFYRQNFSQVLSRTFDVHCCKCGEGMGQLEYDHFGLPKSRGGNFLMRSKAGLYVNNCIPLCRTCNSSKGNRDFRAFFTG